jgi:PAS domain S-box-containing protein
MLGEGVGSTNTHEQVEELDRRRRMRNTRTLSLGMAVLAALLPVPMWLAGIDVRVGLVTLGAAASFGGCAWAARRRQGAVAAAVFNALLALVLFAGVAVNGQIGPGPAFVGFSLFVAVATLPIEGVVAAGLLGAVNVGAMCFVARGAVQLAETPAVALTYGLTLCFVATALSVVQTRNTRRALTQVVDREQRAVAAEARASESEARYRLITDNMSDLVALLDEGARFIYASPSFERVLGLDPAHLVGRETFDLTHPEDRTRALADFTEALAHGKARGSYRCRDKVGRERWVEWLYDAVPGPGGTVVAVAARDVTEPRTLAAQLQQAQKMDALGRMAAAVAHDFNNLLMVITAAVSVTRRQLPEGSPGARLLTDAEQAAAGAAALTARLLAFSRQTPVSAAVVDARQALGGLADLLPRALGTRVALKVDLRGDLPPVMAAPVQLEQVLLNLALNARDAMPNGGTLSIVARAIVLSEGEETDCRAGIWLELEVTDTGTGMSDEVMARVFEPFFTTKAAGKGTGLGLSTCYGIVRQLGGSIRVTSRMGEGTTFRVILPRASRSREAHAESA